MAHVLQMLAEHRLVFTVGDRGLAGFIVHSDLDRQPARTHFYLLVAGIEILLAEIVRLLYPDEKAVEAALRPAAAKQYQRARAAKTEAHPVEYMYLPELVKLFLRSPNVSEFNILDDDSAKWLSSLNHFRRLVMHPACSIAAAMSGVQIADFTRMAADVIGRLQSLSASIDRVGGGYSSDTS
jgi:hypothetical protein